MQGFHTGLMFHRPPMLLVDDLGESSLDGGTATWKIPPDSIFLDSDGNLSRVALMEVMAQSFAATEAYQAFLAGIIKPAGYLVGLDNMDFYGDARSGDTLTTKVVFDGRIDRVRLVRGEVFKDGSLLASGKIRLFSE